MASFGKETVEAAIKRMKKILSIYTDTELSEKLGLTRSGLSSWKTRGSLDIALIQQKITGVSIDYLLYGVGTPLIDFSSMKENMIDGILGIVKDPETGYELKPNINKVLEKQNLIDSIEYEYSTRMPIYYCNGLNTDSKRFNEFKNHYRYEYLVNERTIGIDMNSDQYSNYGYHEGDTLIIDTTRAPNNGDVILGHREGELELLLYIENDSDIYYQEIQNNINKKHDNDGSIDVYGVVISKLKTYK